MGRASQYWLLIGACLTPKEKKNSLNAIMSNSYKNQTNIFFPHNFHFKGSQLLCNSRQREKCSSNLKPWLTPQTKIWLFGPDPGIFRCETVGCDSLAGTRLVLSSNNPPSPSDCTQSRETREKWQFQLCDVSQENLLGKSSYLLLA